MFPYNVYHLKREYGYPVDLYKTKTTHNVETGKKTLERKKIHIRKAIVLPATEAIRNSNMNNFLKANQLETSDRIVVIDSKDVPNSFDIEPDDHVIINHRRYTVDTVEENEYQIGYVLTVKETKGVEKFEIIDVKAKSHVTFTQEVQYEQTLA